MRLMTVTLALLMMATTAAGWHTCPKGADNLRAQLLALAKQARSDAIALNGKCFFFELVQFFKKKVEKLKHGLAVFLAKDLIKIVKINREKIVGHISSIPFLQDLATGSLAVCLSQHNEDHGLSCLFNDKSFTDAIGQIDELADKIGDFTKALEDIITRNSKRVLKRLKIDKDILARLQKELPDAKVAALTKKCVRVSKFHYLGPKQLFAQYISLWKRVKDLTALCKMSAVRALGPANEQTPRAQSEDAVAARAAEVEGGAEVAGAAQGAVAATEGRQGQAQARQPEQEAGQAIAQEAGEETETGAAAAAATEAQATGETEGIGPVDVGAPEGEAAGFEDNADDEA